jgi:hypothetical protein
MQNTEIKTNNLSLQSIAGYAEEKAEAVKIINLFKDYDSLKELGVSIPKGLILSGMPGVGKTLMAKVIAAEANVPLFEYVSMPHITMDKSRVVTTKNPVPVGYILVKRPQQTSIYRLFLLLNNDNKMIGLYKPLELLETPLRTISSTLCPTTNESSLTQVVY